MKIKYFFFPSPLLIFSTELLLPRWISPRPNPPESLIPRWRRNTKIWKMCTRAPRIRLHCRLAFWALQWVYPASSFLTIQLLYTSYKKRRSKKRLGSQCVVTGTTEMVYLFVLLVCCHVSVLNRKTPSYGRRFALLLYIYCFQYSVLVSRFGACVISH